MIDQDSNDFDGDVDEAGNGKGVVTTRNDAGEVLCVTEVISPIDSGLPASERGRGRGWSECKVERIVNGNFSFAKGEIREFRFEGLVTETVPAETRTTATFRGGVKSGPYITAQVDNLFKVRGCEGTEKKRQVLLNVG